MESLQKIVAVGEVLWDVFDSGPRFGGAPANFACSFAALAGRNFVGGSAGRSDEDSELAGLAPGEGESVSSSGIFNKIHDGRAFAVHMISAVGNDELGRQALAELCSHHVETDHVQQNESQTGRVDISVDEKGSPSYVFAQDCAWDHLQLKPDALALVQAAAVICFGSLGQRSEQSKRSIQKLVAASAPDALRIFDINLRDPFYDRATVAESLDLANILKLNDEELPQLAEWFDLVGTEEALLRVIAERWSLDVVALTRGEQGAMILSGKEVHQCAAAPAEIKDTVGAGDAFTAVLALGQLQGWDLALINQRACEFAAFVCSQAGATPATPAIEARFSTW